MNKDNISQIFKGYIDKFDYINHEPHIEYYKWQICHDFPILMDKALSVTDEEFPGALYQVKNVHKT